MHSYAHLVKILPLPVTTPPLSIAELTELIRVAFWASLHFEEGRPTRFALAVVDAKRWGVSLSFASPHPYNERTVVQLAHAAPPGGCLMVDAYSDGLRIVGFGRNRDLQAMNGVVVRATEPGTVGIGLGPFKTFAVFNRESMSIVEGTGIDLQLLLQRLLGKALHGGEQFIETQMAVGAFRALSELTRMVLSDGHGGTILVVPSE